MTNPSPDAALLQLMEEMTEAKQAVQAVLKTSPEDIQLHRIHGMYTGHILDIRKTMLQEAAVDREQLLLDALKGVVTFLIQQGEDAAAQCIGEHLETIGTQVKLSWQDSKPFPSWPAVMKKSAGSSLSKSPPSAKPAPKKKKNANPAR
ncbi:MAG: hypothetical protein OEZ51_07180 [Nitrospinota bacterium]|nr:hypothetical protein [Nitrospinota bacterium]